MRNRSIYVLLFIVPFLCSRVSFAQTGDKPGIIYYSAISGGFQLYNNGWAGNIEFEKIKDLHHTTFWQIEVTQLRDQKEIKQSVDLGFSVVGINSPKPFVYGKQNNFYPINFSRGEQILIGQRANKSGVEVSFKFAGGFSLGILKPYYLQLLVPADNNQDYYLNDEKYSASNRKIFLDPYSIYGSSGFTKGLTEIGIVPGIHAKAGLHFDWAFYDEFIKAIEVGGALDAYPKQVPIMVVSNNRYIFTNFYVGIQFGKKKTSE